MAELSEELVTAARAGDRDAVGAVYAELSPRVYGYLAARGVEDPEGTTSEVFVQVIPKLGGLRGGPAELQTFVFSVAHARVVDEFRRRARRPASSPYEPEQDPRAVLSAETVAFSAEDGIAVQDALRMLNEDQRAVIMLRVLGDLSLEQTADVVGKSIGAVKQLQRRALLVLRSCVERGEVAL